MTSVPVPPPPFPLAALPEWVREHVAAVADEARVTVDAPALLTIAAIGAAAGKRVVIEYGARENHYTNLWTLAVMPPSEGKTPLIGAVARPFRRAQQELHEDFVRREVDRRTDLRILRVRRRQAAQAAARPPAPPPANVAGVPPRDPRLVLRDIEQEVARLEGVGESTLLLEDTTPEALLVTMAANEGVVTMLSDEGSVFFANALRSAHEDLTNIENILKAHSAEDIDQRRISRGAIVVPKPVLAVLIATQPRVVRGLIRRGVFAERGVWERFVYVSPPSTVGGRANMGGATFPLLPGLYSRTVSALLAVPVMTAASAERRVLRFSAEGERVLDAFFADVDRRMGSGDLADPWLVGWAGKLRTNVIRVGAILHLAEMHAAPSVEPNDPANMISAHFAEGAIRIAQWATEQARGFLCGDMDEDDDIRAVTDWIRRRRLRGVRPRDIQHALGHRFPSIQSLMPTIDRMVQRGLLHPRHVGGRIGRPPVEYDVNASVFGYPAEGGRRNDETEGET